jgi:hypothetical protein
MQRPERPQRAEPIKRPVLVQQPTEETLSPFMPAKDAAALLNVSPEHVIRAVLADVIPGFKFGGLYRVLRAFVDDVYTEISAGNAVVIEDFAETWRTKVSEGAA